ncbi:pyridoxamine 5'-phosphate oxidase [Mycolicibacillus koreensis]|nr:pyridoxamine 5'-phosphate oxidase [Mycolicibacillus koreensis]
MTSIDEPITVLPVGECWDLLATVSLGRLVTSVDDQLDIFPVNFAVQNRTVLFRTAEGTKLVSATINSRVLFEADNYNPAEGWSVVVRGRAQVLRSADEIQQAQDAPLLPWTPWLKQNYVRILPTTVTGRRFRFGPEAHEPLPAPS